MHLSGLLVAFLPLTAAFVPTNSQLKAPQLSRHFPLRMSAQVTTSEPAPICLVVTVEIAEDRIEPFLVAIEADAIGSRTEPGCLRFDVLRDKEQTNKFSFIEVYTDSDAIAFHKQQPHFALWSNFKAEGGVLSQTVLKTDAIFFSG